MNQQEVISDHIEKFNGCSALCVGDLILDNFVYGTVDRISPEAPVPVFRIRHEETMLGGAGNVVRNLIALGAETRFLSVVGDDTVGKTLTAMVGAEEHIEPYLQVEKGRTSTKKIRYIARQQQLLRADHETTETISEHTEKQVLKLAQSILAQVNIVILSDYAKGVLTPPLTAALIEAARKAKKPVIVDPKRKDFSVYRGASVITPNVGELAAATRLPVKNDAQIIKACEALIKEHGFEAVLVTRSEKGMSLVTKQGEHYYFPAAAQEIFDVSGAGDTVIATLAAALSTGLAIKEAAYLANLAAGIVVRRLGTSVVHRTDLKTALVTSDMVSSSRKILPLDSALPLITQWRNTRQKIGFTNGCFDLIHPGHIALMDQAKQQCDRLVVGLNSDDSVKRLKGPSRPIQNEMARALVLASLEAVDMVVLFREDTPLKLIEAVRPDVLVKGADYKHEEVVGAELVEKYGGKVFLAKISDGQSTSNIVKKIAL